MPCWVMTPSKPAWRYGLTDPTMAWYGDWVKLYRQQMTDLWNKDEDWSEVLGQIAEDLTALLSERSAA